MEYNREGKRKEKTTSDVEFIVRVTSDRSEIFEEDIIRRLKGNKRMDRDIYNDPCPISTSRDHDSIIRRVIAEKYLHVPFTFLVKR